MSLDLSCDELMVMGLRPCGGGKSAYAYAVEGGYTGTEEEFGIRLAALLNEGITATVDTHTNRITLSGALTPGTYSAYYELTNSDGTKSLLEIGELTLDEETEPTIYTVTFVADGAAVSTKTYTVENPVVEEPAVPAKEGYTGVWETYDLTKGGNITVNAVYTAIEVEPAEPKNFAEYNADNTADWSIWINNARAGSDGNYRPDTYSDSFGTPAVSNYIAVQNGDVVEFSGMYAANKSSILYNSQKAFIAAGLITNLTANLSEASLNNEEYTGQFTVNSDSVAYVRIGGYHDIANRGIPTVKIKRNGEYLIE